MKAQVTISRASDNRIYIKIEDCASHIQFVEASMTLEDFGSAITGVGMQDADLEVRGLANVGKFRVTEKRSKECPIKTYDKDVLIAWLKANAQEEGWILDTYLGSQGSVNLVGDKTILNYSVTKFVAQEPKP